jgi:phosphatidate cytidylyltransferase
MADGNTASNTSDLPLRLISAVVMVLVAGVALWQGGWIWMAFVAIIGLGVFWEWTRLAFAISDDMSGRIAWLVLGAGYIALGCIVLGLTRVSDFGSQFHPNSGIVQALCLIATVVGVDAGGYFAGRAIGGPRIAPSISPSKTWAGLVGAILGAFTFLTACIFLSGFFLIDMPGYGGEVLASSFGILVLFAVLVAIVAQAGDFFESWMKRKAGVKDSSGLLPGHGGLFDRVDGLLAVCVMLGLFLLIGRGF